MQKLCILLLTMFSLSSCQHTGLFLANLLNDNQGYTTAQNIAYGEQEWQTLDIHTPVEIQNSTPVIVFFYGGGWTQGTKEQYRFVADRLTQEGFIVVIPDYIKYPDATYPAYVEDAATATKWIVGNIEKHKENAEQLFIMGHSAGAHTAAMLLTDRKYLQQHELTPNIYKGFVGISGPYHFTPEASKFKKVFGGIPYTNTCRLHIMCGAMNHQCYLCMVNQTSS